MSNPYVKADTMSVITQLNDNPESHDTSVSISIQIGPDSEDLNNYCNATLRLDRGHKAVICGYPQSWSVWSEPIEAFNSESPNGEEVFDYDGLDLEDFGFQYHISRVDEYNILKQLKDAVISQFRKPEWKDSNPNIHGKLAVLQKIEEALNSPEFSHIKEVA